LNAVKRLIVIVLFEGVDLLDVTGPPEVFSLARRETDEAAGYDVVLVAETMDPVTTAAGVRILPDITFEELSRKSIDTLVVPGSVEVDSHRRVHPITDPSLVKRVKQLAGRTRRVTSVCVGAHILAAAGLLDGKRATTHWASIDWLREHYPAIDVRADERVVDEGHIITSAGVSAGIDMALHVVSRLHGHEVAADTARGMEYDWNR
jgi:transcriptional regulator GlxA family with amidase domain